MGDWGGGFAAFVVSFMPYSNTSATPAVNRLKNPAPKFYIQTNIIENIASLLTKGD